MTGFVQEREAKAWPGLMSRIVEHTIHFRVRNPNAFQGGHSGVPGSTGHSLFTEA